MGVNEDRWRGSLAAATWHYCCDDCGAVGPPFFVRDEAFSFGALHRIREHGGEVVNL